MRINIDSKKTEKKETMKMKMNKEEFDEKRWLLIRNRT